MWCSSSGSVSSSWILCLCTYLAYSVPHFTALDGSSPFPCLSSLLFTLAETQLGSGPKSLFTQFVLLLGLKRWCWKDGGLNRPGSVFSLCWFWVHPLHPSLAPCGCPWPPGHPQLPVPLSLSLIYSTLAQLRDWSLLSPSVLICWCGCLLPCSHGLHRRSQEANWKVISLQVL